MIDLSNKTAMVVDYGWYIHIAQRLLEDFGKVRFYNPAWRCAFPKCSPLLVGRGLGLEVVKSLEPYLEDTDLFVVPDLYQGDTVNYLRSIGKRVWGSGNGDLLEVYRWQAREKMRELGLETSDALRIEGLDALREHLKVVEDKYVKVSLVRGEMETFHHINYEMSERWLNDLQHRLGPISEIMEFIVEDPIEPAQEWGYDGFTVDGQYPGKCLIGYEKKGESYFGAIMDYGDVPKDCLEMNRKLSPWFQQTRYRNFFSTEVRNGILIDPCCRAPSPPNELYPVLWNNFSQVIWCAGGGEVCDPECDNKYGALAAVYVERAGLQPHAIKFPKEKEPFLKLHNLCLIGDTYYVLPLDIELTKIGFVAGAGKTPQEAIDQCTEHAEGIEGDKITVHVERLADALAEAQKGEQHGIKIL